MYEIMGIFYFFGATSLRGRPRGRRLASSPRRVAVRMTQAGAPKGVPRFMLHRRAAVGIGLRRIHPCHPVPGQGYGAVSTASQREPLSIGV